MTLNAVLSAETHSVFGASLEPFGVVANADLLVNNAETSAESTLNSIFGASLEPSSIIANVGHNQSNTEISAAASLNSEMGQCSNVTNSLFGASLEPSSLNRNGVIEKIKRFQCSKCNVKFTTIDKLRKHRSTSHIVKKTYPCDFCLKGFKSERLAIEHERTLHLGVVHIDCSICGLRFNRYRQLQAHGEEVHGI